MNHEIQGIMASIDIINAIIRNAMLLTIRYILIFAIIVKRGLSMKENQGDAPMDTSFVEVV
jgi:uncharacterized SAM-binding protein YcdF (DUF218 family)